MLSNEGHFHSKNRALLEAARIACIENHIMVVEKVCPTDPHNTWWYIWEYDAGSDVRYIHDPATTWFVLPNGEITKLEEDYK